MIRQSKQGGSPRKPAGKRNIKPRERLKKEVWNEIARKLLSGRSVPTPHALAKDGSITLKNAKTMALVHGLLLKAMDLYTWRTPRHFWWFYCPVAHEIKINHDYVLIIMCIIRRVTDQDLETHRYHVCFSRYAIARDVQPEINALLNKRDSTQEKADAFLTVRDLSQEKIEDLLNERDSTQEKVDALLRTRDRMQKKVVGLFERDTRKLSRFDVCVLEDGVFLKKWNEGYLSKLPPRTPSRFNYSVLPSNIKKLLERKLNKLRKAIDSADIWPSDKRTPTSSERIDKLLDDFVTRYSFKQNCSQIKKEKQIEMIVKEAIKLRSEQYGR